MEVIRKTALVMLALGLLLAVSGHFQFAASHRNAAYKLPWVASQILPGWALLIMGWTGYVGCQVWRHLTRRSTGVP